MFNGTGRRNLLKAFLGALTAGALVNRYPAPAIAQQTTTPKPTGNSKLYAVLNRGTLVVGTATDNPPFGFLDEHGKAAGFDIEISRLLAKGLFNNPDKVEFVFEGYDARIPNLLTDKVDVVLQSMTATAARAQQVEFSTPYYREGESLLIPKNGKYKSYEALLRAGSNARIAYLQNVTSEQVIHEALPKAQIVLLATVGDSIQASLSGRADATVNNNSTVRWLSTTQSDKWIAGGFSWFPQTYSVVVKPGDPTWLNFINTALHEAMSGIDFPIYKAAFKKYYGVEIPGPYIGFPLELAWRPVEWGKGT